MNRKVLLSVISSITVAIIAITGCAFFLYSDCGVYINKIGNELSLTGFELIFGKYVSDAVFSTPEVLGIFGFLLIVGGIILNVFSLSFLPRFNFLISSSAIFIGGVLVYVSVLTLNLVPDSPFANLLEDYYSNKNTGIFVGIMSCATIAVLLFKVVIYKISAYSRKDLDLEIKYFDKLSELNGKLRAGEITTKEYKTLKKKILKGIEI